MLSLLHEYSRREWLRLGGLGSVFGPLSLTTLQATPRRRPRNCIVLFLLGAPPQHETWDPKPDVPAEIRGDLKPIASATPGLRVGELMPLTAKLTNHIAVLRGMQTLDNAHSSSGYYMTTGVPHAPMQVENAKPGAPNDWPAMGAIVRKLVKQRGSLPSAVSLPETPANDGNILWPGQDAGFLGRAADPWLLTCDPNSAKFEVPGLTLPQEVPGSRFDGRRSLKDAMDAHLAKLGDSHAHDARTQQAFSLLSSPEARRAFDLNAEPVKVRERYGRSRFGQSVLLARRLIEAGVSLVRVNWTRVEGAPNNGHWDTHAKNTDGLKALMPIMDKAYSALLEDLAIRGMLDDTLVVWMGEFGRTPKINGNGGRDHWGQVFSVALAGGGVRGGTVYGASDSIAGYPKDGHLRPADLLATVYHSLGIPKDSEIIDPQGRPIPISRGNVVHQVF